MQTQIQNTMQMQIRNIKTLYTCTTPIHNTTKIQTQAMHYTSTQYKLTTQANTTNNINTQRKNAKSNTQIQIQKHNIHTQRKHKHTNTKAPNTKCKHT